MGPYTRDIPSRPVVHGGQSERHLLAVAETPTKHAHIHWFLCDNDADLEYDATSFYYSRLLFLPEFLFVFLSIFAKCIDHRFVSCHIF